MFVSNDEHRAFGNDFDVRTHASNEERNKFILDRVKDNVFTIRSKTNPNHHLFCSNDKVRGFGDDFDVRTHDNHSE